MLTVKLHLCNGDVITTTLTLAQKNRLSRTLNQAVLPATPFILNAGGAELEIPWRTIGYISSEPVVKPEFQAQEQEAAD
ncbi:hypothetical protein DAETH_29230 [Deinococcus aetherius]|uniref:Uncharacterized protein n=1 Tax=Deinococcus aetherius TaxID=200252 RepID=A0ABM8AGN4_9DEIO|nr:hypothetical protein [Deinococcus aetherius]BDP42954.1 hypothetical protein DAETH_29230 [Deinococcus aetherius]